MNDTTVATVCEQLRLSIAARVDELRAEQGLSYRGLARGSGKAGQTVFSFMKGSHNPQLSTVVALAEALDCDIRLIFRPRRHASVPNGVTGATCRCRALQHRSKGAGALTCS